MENLYFEQLDEYREAWDPTNLEQLIPSERFWGAHYIWLKTCGYLLRPRYSPDWVPSWIGTKKNPYTCEDGVISIGFADRLMDAIRIRDGKPVALKMTFKSQHPHEAEIMTFLSSEPLASDPMNHCIPVFDILEVPHYGDMIILIMPLVRRCNDPRFETVGEAVEFFRQIIEGLHFMHKYHIAHRDCSVQNIMMDPGRLYPNWYHPIEIDATRDLKGSAKHYTRTERPPKYLLIDFGLSRRYDPKDGPPLELSIRGGDKTVPEFQGEKYHKPSNPFFTDIYYLGNMIKEEFLDTTFGFEFMSSLVADMMQQEPTRRPVIAEVEVRFGLVCQSLSTAYLRSRIVQRKEEYPLRWWRNSVHFFRKLRFILQRIPPVPRADITHTALSEVGLRPGPSKS